MHMCGSGSADLEIPGKRKTYQNNDLERRIVVFRCIRGRHDSSEKASDPRQTEMLFFYDQRRTLMICAQNRQYWLVEHGISKCSYRSQCGPTQRLRTEVTIQTNGKYSAV